MQRHLIIALALLALACKTTPRVVTPDPAPEPEPVEVRPEPPAPPALGWDPADTANLAGKVVVAHTSSLTALAVLLDAAQLDDELWGQGPITLLAPTDAAFAAMELERLELLRDPANLEALRTFLRAHVLRGRLSAAQLTQDTHATLDGQPLAPGQGQRGVAVRGAEFLRVDIATRDATIHIIDRPIAQPPKPTTAPTAAP
jgi:uncharacterized surface protein with fasciclin (FAS1) repeats